jgi:hypothetical protein
MVGVCGSSRQAEELTNELDLPAYIVVRNPFHLSLPHHVNCFVSLDGSSSRAERYLGTRQNLAQAVNDDLGITL